MSLRDIQYQEDYRSGYDNMLGNFFRPSLCEAQLYWRAVGYFSSSSLEAFGAPLGDFIKNGGHIRLVTSVELSEADLRAIENGAVKQDVCAQRIELIIENDFADGVGDGVVRLARLLEMGRLEIRIAVPRTGTGIYHEKIGLFIDGDDFVAFAGSSNESRTAFENNRECLDVYPSWSSASRAERKRIHFETLWDRTDVGVAVYSFPEAAQKKLLRVCGEWEAAQKQRPQQQTKKWRHQDEAVEKFLAAERGVLKMATGTGKTRTALKIFETLFARHHIDTVIVSADGNDLLDQWYRVLLDTRKTIGRDVHIFKHYGGVMERQDFALDPRNAILLASREPAAPSLRRLSDEQAGRTLLVHDEVHRLGSPANRERLDGLSDNVRFRLGLSATPERTYDDEGNAFIEDHIGPVLFSFGLREAIERGILAPFNYFPLSFELTDADGERIKKIYGRRKAREVAGNPMTDVELQIEIARVYKTSENKLPVFTDFIQNNKPLLERCIVFVETQEFGAAVLDIVHEHRPDFHTYFSGEQSDTLQRFLRGDLECLITCHRLSEGIDIPSLNSVILFSSEKGRLETVQRLGRCLRTDPINPGKIANIVDFIRDGGEKEDPNTDEERRDWLIELSRVRTLE